MLIGGPGEVVGLQLSVWCPVENVALKGKVTVYDPNSEEHTVKYEGGETVTIQVATAH